MNRQFAIIGLGRFGFNMAKTLAENKCEVIAIDKDEERVRKASDYVTLAVQLDAMDEKALRAVGVQNVDVGIVSIGENIEASILAVMILKQMGVKYIVAKAVTKLHGAVLKNLDVDRIVYPERDMAIRVAHSLVRPTILEQLELSDEYSIIEIPTPGVFIGKMLRETTLRSEYHVNLIAIKDTDKSGRENWNVNPLPTDIIREGDLLVIVGQNKDLEKLSQF